jgi:predicted helicase
MLLAYYIACVNIETTYQAIANRSTPPPDDKAQYTPFAGATLTDTFQITEDGDRADTSLIPVNNDRIEAQLAAPIKVIIGNPPYSAGQGSANDDNANLKYPSLDARIAETYAARSSATNKNSLYDSYIRAFRWATDRLGDQGVIAFVSNNGWVDGNTADGLRKTFTDEFSDIWVYNLRGNQRTAGELSRQEGGKVFGSGARTGVAVLVAAKRRGAAKQCNLSYHGVADYQTREEKLAGIEVARLATMRWQPIAANGSGDWLNQRNDAFSHLPALGSKDAAISDLTYFSLHSAGLKTARDAWCYSFSRTALETNMASLIASYNAAAAVAGANTGHLDMDPTRVSWSRGLLRDAARGVQHDFRPERIYAATYRPYTKMHAYYDRPLNDMVYRLGDIFPSPHHSNQGITIIENGARAPFSVLMAGGLPDSKVYVDAAQFFPRWTYEKATGGDQASLLESSTDGVDQWGYRRVDNITDGILTRYREKFGPQVSKDDIFSYVYGVLHSEQYRTAFAADLKRMLPRIPLAASPSDFDAFAEAGRKLSDLHVHYESVEPYPLAEQAPFITDPWETFRVEKMRWADKATKKAIVYNRHITLGDIPAEAHRYTLGSRSALEWLIDRYQVKTDKDSGIVNDPNDWCREHDNPRYIVDLVKRVTRVSVETTRIAEGLPEIPLHSVI